MALAPSLSPPACLPFLGSPVTATVAADSFFGVFQSFFHPARSFRCASAPFQRTSASCGGTSRSSECASASSGRASEPSELASRPFGRASGSSELASEPSERASGSSGREVFSRKHAESGKNRTLFLPDLTLLLKSHFQIPRRST